MGAVKCFRGCCRMLGRFNVCLALFGDLCFFRIASPLGSDGSVTTSVGGL